MFYWDYVGPHILTHTWSTPPTTVESKNCTHLINRDSERIVSHLVYCIHSFQTPCLFPFWIYSRNALNIHLKRSSIVLLYNNSIYLHFQVKYKLNQLRISDFEFHRLFYLNIQLLWLVGGKGKHYYQLRYQSLL